jgi:hypothetical protein
VEEPFVLNLAEIKKPVSDVFACVATRATAVDMKIVAVGREVRAVVQKAADIIATAGLEQVGQTEALPENEVLFQNEVQGEALLDVREDGNSKKVVPRKRSTNF